MECNDGDDLLHNSGCLTAHVAEFSCRDARNEMEKSQRRFGHLTTREKLKYESKYAISIMTGKLAKDAAIFGM